MAYSERIKKEVAERYENGESSFEISKDLGCTRNTVISFLDQYNVNVRSYSESGQTDMNHRVFNSLDENTEYWIGFLMADGCVSKKYNRISLELQRSDIEHVKKFKSFVNCPNKIQFKENTVRFVFSSLEIKNQLNKYGVVPNKSQGCKAKGKIKKSRHFWRGMVDGDGHITKQPFPRIVLTGQRGICEQFADYSNKKVNSNISARKTESCFRVESSKGTALKLFDLLYEDSEVYLKRKYLFNN